MDVARCNLEGNADAVEFCPHDGCRHVLTASTYILQEGDRLSRAGRISLLTLVLNWVGLICFSGLKQQGFL
ncbi:hypothetical protein FF1_015384 [Malus domestica]